MSATKEESLNVRLILDTHRFIDRKLYLSIAWGGRRGEKQRRTGKTTSTPGGKRVLSVKNIFLHNIKTLSHTRGFMLPTRPVIIFWVVMAFYQMRSWAFYAIDR